jgi:hypothetical protein
MWLALAMTFVACGPVVDTEPPDPPVQAVQIAPIDGTDARVGITVADGAVQAYVCGGPDTRVTHTRWFVGDSPPLLQDDWTLDWDGVHGTLTDPGGVVATFTLEDQSGRAGLYDGDDSGCRDGAIVWDDGGTPALQGTWGCYTTSGEAIEVYPVGTLKLADTVPAWAQTSTGKRTFDLHRLGATDAP